LPQLEKISPFLWAKAAGGATTFLVILAEQADLAQASELKAASDRRRHVYDSLRAVALRSQKPLATWLEDRGIAFQSHYLVNMLTVTGDRALLAVLASRPEVARLEANPTVKALDPLTLPEKSGAGDGASPGTATRQGVEWGINYVKAPAVWQQYNVRGQGIVVGGQDTGVQWDHPALKAQYRGWNGTTAEHNYDWHDAIGSTSRCPSPAEPCDPLDHGTHTIGTMVGDDGAGNQIGVAPGAMWIACRNMDELGKGTPSTYTECFEFLLAPYPIGGNPLTDGDPSLGADIINNSWSCPPAEGCSADTLRQVVENLRAAGVLVVVSAGNYGSACSSVIYPPAIYDASFSVGAVSYTGTLAPFSSRGPVMVDGSYRSKPDIVAPGVDVVSSVPDGYAKKNGTSVAAPHVAGVAALLWSADPSLVGQIDDTEFVLTQTAQHVDSSACGDNGWPNNSYGWGYVDALAAIEAVRLPAPVTAAAYTIACNGTVRSNQSGVSITLVNGSTGEVTTVNTTDSGAALTLPPGSYAITAKHPITGVTASKSQRFLGNRPNQVTFDFVVPDTICRYVPAVSRNASGR
jgi:subtilisin family serine protease